MFLLRLRVRTRSFPVFPWYNFCGKAGVVRLSRLAVRFVRGLRVGRAEGILERDRIPRLLQQNVEWDQPPGGEGGAPSRVACDV